MRLRTASVALATVALVSGAATLAIAADAAPDASPDGARYVDPLGWSISSPRSMHLERARSPRFLGISIVQVASFPLRNPIRSGSTANGSWMRVDPPRDPRGAFPADGVAFRIVRSEGGPVPDLELPESRFPIRLATFGRSRAYANTSPHPLGRTVVADGRNYTAQAWIGPKASTAERATLARVVSSLAFPHPRVGQTVGYGFRVFEQASRYPAGSFTRLRAQGQPFYLAHAPGGFYALGWRWESLAGGYKSHCDLRLDPARKRFFCTNMTASWDLVGRVLVKPPGETRGDPLNVTLAKVAWDGHMLLLPGAARFADARYAHELWPALYPRR